MTSVEITDAVTVPDYAFNGCGMLTGICLNEGVTAVGSYAFRGCTGLETMVLPDSVRTLGTGAFYNCGALRSVTLSAALESIAADAFRGCTALQEVNAASLAAWIAVDLANADTANPLAGGAALLVDGTPVDDCAIPNDAVKIGSYKFAGHTELAGITIPAGVTAIGSYAYSGCTSLMAIGTMSGVTDIADYAFDGCTALDTIFYRGTESDWAAIRIGEYNAPLLDARKYYSAFITVTVDDSTHGLLNYRVNNETPVIGVSTIDLTVWETDTVTITPVPADGYFFGAWSDGKHDSPLVLNDPGRVTISGSFLSTPAVVTENVLSLPAALTEIEESAFDGIASSCIVIPANVTGIGASAFVNCRNLVQVRILSEDVEFAEGALAGIDSTKVYFFAPEGSATAAALRGLGMMVVEQ